MRPNTRWVAWGLVAGLLVSAAPALANGGDGTNLAGTTGMIATAGQAGTGQAGTGQPAQGQPAPGQPAPGQPAPGHAGQDQAWQGQVGPGPIGPNYLGPPVGPGLGVLDGGLGGGFFGSAACIGDVRDIWANREVARTNRLDTDVGFDDTLLSLALARGTGVYINPFSVRQAALFENDFTQRVDFDPTDTAAGIVFGSGLCPSAALIAGGGGVLPAGIGGGGLYGGLGPLGLYGGLGATFAGDIVHLQDTELEQRRAVDFDTTEVLSSIALGNLGFGYVPPVDLVSSTSARTMLDHFYDTSNSDAVQAIALL